MSRAYRISASESARRHVKVEDGVCTGLELLDVLPQETMGELLAKELEGRGFKRDGDVLTRKDADGVEITVNVKEGTVTAKLAQEHDIDVQVERSQTVAEEVRAAAQAKLDEAVKSAIEKQVGARTEKLREEVTKKLEGKLKDLQRELDSVTNRVTAEALKQKAASLGEIEEITEDAETGNLTIKVRT